MKSLSWDPTHVLLKLTARLMPPGRAMWMKAMIAETSCCSNADRLRFALGCFSVAARLRLADAARGSGVELIIGSLAGALFLLHVFVPDSRSWPWIWPVFGGAAAAVTGQQRPGGRWDLAVAGAKTGLICASLFLAGGALMLIGGLFYLEPSTVWRAAGLIAYGAAGALVLSPISAFVAALAIR